MKVILTGATGFVGTEVLHQCLQNPKITSIVALSRRPLPSTPANSSKLKTVIMEDFMKYPEGVLEELAGAEACVWCLGSASFPDQETCRRVSIDYTTAGLDAILTNPPPQLGHQKKPFRFVYVSGMMVERDQSRSLWFLGEFRRIRGQVETNVITAATQYPGKLQPFIARPGGVLKKPVATEWTRPVMNAVLGAVVPTVRVDELAAALIDLAVTGDGAETWENRELKIRGAQLLKGSA